jgi:hypothetical protein
LISDIIPSNANDPGRARNRLISRKSIERKKGREKGREKSFPATGQGCKNFRAQGGRGG